MPLMPMLTQRFTADAPWMIDNYEALDGYTRLRAALMLAPDELIAMVNQSNLRGRGGAGFPTGMKWQFIPRDDGRPHYVVVNGDEGEPGTCRDLPLMMTDPHSLIEGIIIACDNDLSRTPRCPRSTAICWTRSPPGRPPFCPAPIKMNGP